MKKSRMFLTVAALAIAVVGAFAFKSKFTVTYYLDEGGSPVTKTASAFPCSGTTGQCTVTDGGTAYNAYYDQALTNPIHKQ
ncbi:MAG: hypothetical protein BGO55_08610 [Sphingobacteriales bacterium 50-39]|nr:hypothetical protein [Sphingobacteriales bacterium]OJW59325.1 MAG: hypothetical protein BGO55_08610 [Sphingobacteriales bacterium 50-39]